MGLYRLLFKPSVEKDLRAIPKTDASKILKRILALPSDPFPPYSAKLMGTAHL